jgi:hypothetical protein
MWLDPLPDVGTCVEYHVCSVRYFDDTKDPPWEHIYESDNRRKVVETKVMWTGVVIRKYDEWATPVSGFIDIQRDHLCDIVTWPAGLWQTSLAKVADKSFFFKIVSN